MKTASNINEPEWYSYKGVYRGNYPAYFNRADYDWVAASEARFPAFESAFHQYVKSHSKELQPYFLKELPTTPESWQLANFYFWGIRNNKACTLSPEMDDFFRSIPGLLSASISKLSAHAEIKPHYGDSNVMIRAHLGVVVPAGLPLCGLEVQGEQRGWDKGKWLLFCDAHYHRAWNNSEEDRYVIIADIIHPHFAHRKDEICRNIFSLMKLQQLGQKYPLAYRLPGFIRGGIRHFYKWCYYLGILDPKQLIKYNN